MPDLDYKKYIEQLVRLQQQIYDIKFAMEEDLVLDTDTEGDFISISDKIDNIRARLVDYAFSEGQLEWVTEDEAE